MLLSARDKLSGGVLVAAVALMVVGYADGDGGNCPWFRAGIVLALAAGFIALRAHGQTSAEMVERARQDGYDDGYRDGCAVSRSSGRAPVRALRGASHQLSQEGDLGRRADRVG